MDNSNNNIDDDDSLNMMDMDVDNHNDNISITEIRDAVVAPTTSSKYAWYIHAFLDWCFRNEPGFFTNYGRLRFERLRQQEGESREHMQNRVKNDLMDLLRGASENPIVVLENLTARRFMQFVKDLRNTKPKKNTTNTYNPYLSQSSYTARRSALYHLFRLHNNSGYNPEFKAQLNGFYKGFFRTLARRSSSTRRNNPETNNDEATAAGGGTDAGTEAFTVLGTVATAATDHVVWTGAEEGKEPMSVELLRAVCGWFLNWGTGRGVWCHTYLLLTWNLMCRSESTALIKLSDIVWNTSFDALYIVFGHTKTDQTGKHSKHPRHIYANTTSPLVCPVTALAMYFSCCFNTQDPANCIHLFPPGINQEVRFAKAFAQVLRENEVEVNRLGYTLSELGTHSIRKGASSYITSLPGGPPPIAVALRGGWNMGNVPDRYYKYAPNGDQYTGRCLSLSNILSISLAASPPFFDVDVRNVEENDRLLAMIRAQYPLISNYPGFGKLSRMCLASLLYHRDWIVNNLHTNHTVRTDSYCFRCEDAQALTSSNILKVTYPWNDTEHVFTGVPPHAVLLQQLKQLREEQVSLVENFVGNVVLALQQYGVNQNRLTENRLVQVLEGFQNELINKLNRLNLRLNETDNNNNNILERVETHSGYNVHWVKGIPRRVPPTWRFPRCGVQDLWRQWWIGDKVLNIWPLRHIILKDVDFLDDIALDQSEMHGRTGRDRENRRQTRKILCDMKFLMNYVHKKVKERNAEEETITIGAVDRMFASVSDLFIKSERDVQKQWRTIVKEIRQQIAQENREQEIVTN